ncbi:hypothetical protein BK135_16195 [Paenibacillus peoriae]|nr:hypothetical protein BK135_16195 [Paenibacillus peoriae]
MLNFISIIPLKKQLQYSNQWDKANPFKTLTNGYEDCKNFTIDMVNHNTNFKNWLQSFKPIMLS